jgi:hypothetical protein
MSDSNPVPPPQEGSHAAAKQSGSRVLSVTRQNAARRVAGRLPLGPNRNLFGGKSGG